jgi:hypothetical protein
MVLMEQINYAVIITVIGYYVLERMDETIQEKLRTNKKLTNIEELVVKYVNPLLNFVLRVYPFVLMSVAGVVVYNQI